MPQPLIPSAADNATDGARLHWRFGGIELDEVRMELRRNDQPVEIEPKPLELLMFLLRHAGEVVTRQEILQALWLGRIVSDGVITNCVAKLRTALGDEEQSVVRTVPRYGYRLVADITCQMLETPSPAVSASLGFEPGHALPLRAHWILQRHLSSGAHGEIWLAVQQKTGEQRVIKFARDANGLAGIKREITLYRVLSETLGEEAPCIRLLDWNIQQSPFFLETEYSEHGSLLDWCESRGGLARMPLELRIELAAQCAAAVAAAHSAGVLHKDLKPANIIVELDAQKTPRLKLCDFAAGHVMHTERLQQLGITRFGMTDLQSTTDATGTPLYQPPEVLAGQPPTQLTDVFALGVLLYQLVIGDFKRAPAAGWEAEVADPLLRQDIALAAAGDIRRRLGDAGQLAQRLRDLPARREHARLQQEHQQQELRVAEALKRAQARRGPLIALAVLLAVGIAVTGWLYQKEYAARQLASAQVQAAEVIQTFLTEDLLGPANPLTAAGADVTVRQLLNAGVQSLDQRFPQDSVAKAKLRKVMGAAYGVLGDIGRAEPLLLAAERSLAQQLGDDHPDTQGTRMALRDSYRVAQRLVKVGEVAARVVAAEEHAGKARSALWYDAASSVAFTRCIAEAGAIWLADCSLPVRALIPQAQADLGARHPVTARLLWLGGVLQVYAGQVAAAEPLLRQALSLFFEHYMPGNPRVAEARLYWAAALGATGQPQQAKTEILGVIRDFDKSVGSGQSLALVARVFLARVQLDLHEVTLALDLLRDVYRQRLSLFGPDNFGTVQGLETLVLALIQNGQAAEAVQLLQASAQAIALKGSAADRFETLRVHMLLAQALRAAGRDAEAAPLLQQNLEQARLLLVHRQWLLGQIAAQWGQWLAEHGQPDQGLPLLREGAEILEQRLGAQHPRSRRAQAALQKALAGN